MLGFLLLLLSKFLLTKASTNSCSLLGDIEPLQKLFNASDETINELKNFNMKNVTHASVFLIIYNGHNKTLRINPKKAAAINSQKATKVIVHGWSDNPQLPWIQEVAHKFNEKGFNVLAVNWTSFSLQNYFTAAVASQYIGYVIADQLLQIAKIKKNFLETVHVIGHSMGGQIAGFIGKRIIEKGAKLDRISGLDAAGPLFETPVPKSKECRLSKDDAGFVDLIHTEVVVRGVLGTYGDADFYVNDGVNQLNCSKNLPDINKFDSCGHQSVHFYYSKTITDPKIYEGVSCPSYVLFKTGSCNGNKKAYMGEGVQRSAKGKYFVKIDKDGNPENKK